MSEEELIEKLSNYLKDSLGKDLIKALKTTLDKLQKENEDMREELQMYVDTPISKLKEENKYLQERLEFRVNYCNELEHELYENGNFIHKETIRNKIKELENTYSEHSEFRIGKTIEVLEELLGE